MVQSLVTTVKRSSSTPGSLLFKALVGYNMVTPDIPPSTDLETEKCLLEYSTPGSDVSVKRNNELFVMLDAGKLLNAPAIAVSSAWSSLNSMTTVSGEFVQTDHGPNFVYIVITGKVIIDCFLHISERGHFPKIHMDETTYLGMHAALIMSDGRIIFVASRISGS